MPAPTVDVNALAQSGLEALRNGNPRGARASFERIIAAGHANASICLGLAYACRTLKDKPAALAAIDKTLGLDPRNLRALIFKADHFADDGDARAAASFYQAAVAIAPLASELAPDLRGDLARAQTMCERYAAQFEAFLRDRLAASGMVERRSTRRFAQALDILCGKKQIYVQRPRTFYFPELAQIQFYDSDAFPWLDTLERGTAEIRGELIEVMKDRSAFTPYVEGDSRRPSVEQVGLLNNPEWSAFYLWKFGEIVPENAARCPRTMKALAEVPLARVKNRSPSVLFSLLRPHAHIPAHSGLVNTRLIGHLPLIVPKGCSFRVGNETREWNEGKTWFFDDTIEHEAWNRSDETRVILLFEIWRPELTEEERTLVCTLFEAIDSHSGQQPAWET